jgi:transcriptional regulator with XRE-family HTH domain
MDDLQVGRAIRAVRLRLGLRQRDVAERAGVSQQSISVAERGRLDQLSLRVLRDVANAVEIRLAMMPTWRGGQLARLLDAAHAQLVDSVAAMLHRYGWTVLVEYTFNHFGDRGSVDLIGWHPERRALALIEVKSRIVDQQDLHAAMSRKRRIVPSLLARERGWQADVIGELLVVAESRAARSVVRGHSATFDARLPARGVAARAWVRNPQRPIAACWFLAPTSRRGAKQKAEAPRRMRRAAARSGVRGKTLSTSRMPG